MAANNRYEFVFKNETETESKKKKNPVAGNGSEAKENGGQGEGQGGKDTKKAIAKGIVVYRTAKSFVNQVVSHNVSTVSLRTGSEELQQRLSFAYEVGQKAFGMVESVFIGAAVGNLPGAIIGGLLSAAHTAISYAQKAETISLQRPVESVSLRNQQIRAGGSLATFSGSRTQNQ